MSAVQAIAPAGASQSPSGYSLPRRVHQRLLGALTGYAYASDVIALATFSARFHSVPSRLDSTFVVDRRAINGRSDLGLDENQTRRAREKLEEIGFYERDRDQDGYQVKPNGETWHKPTQFRFGRDYWTIFAHACRAARRRLAEATARAKRSSATGSEPKVVSEPRRRVKIESGVSRILRTSVSAFSQMDQLGGSKFHLGEVAKGSRPVEPDNGLEAAFERLRKGVFGEKDDP